MRELRNTKIIAVDAPENSQPDSDVDWNFLGE